LELTVDLLTFSFEFNQYYMAIKNTILVVDDEDGLRTLVINELTRAGHIVEGASGGTQAITLLRRNRYALAILDIKMPDIDGIEVLKFIHANCPTTKAIMLTGYTDLSNAMECMKLGAKDFIDKPFNLLDLLSTVDRILKE